MSNLDRSFSRGTGRLALFVVFLGAFIFIVNNGQSTMFLLQNSQVRAAAARNQYEPETGTFTGGVGVFTDAVASDGRYIEFGLSATTTPVVNTPTLTSVPTNTPPVASDGFQPSAPYYSTFYYMWYKNPKTDGEYSYWEDGHVDPGSPPNTWFAHYLPDPEPTVFDPVNELYSANDYNNFKWQAEKMAEARLEVVIASWWGPGTKEDTAFKKILGEFMKREDNPYPNLRWVIYYEDEGWADPAISTLVADLTHIKNNFAASPHYLKVGGKPVIYPSYSSL